MSKFCTKCGTPINEGQACPNCSVNRTMPPSQPWGQSPGNTTTQEMQPAPAPQPPWGQSPGNMVLPSYSNPTFTRDQQPPPASMNYGSNENMGLSAALKQTLISFMNRAGIGDPEFGGAGVYERGMLITPDSIKPTEGEIPIKQYNVAVLRTRLKLERAEGRMQVTNKRLLFRATGRSIAGRTTLHHEFAIKNIAGIEVRKDFRFSLFDFFLGCVVLHISAAVFGGLIMLMNLGNAILATTFGVIFGIVGAVPVFIWHKKFWIKLMTAGAGLGSMATGVVSVGIVSPVAPLFLAPLAIISLLIALFSWLLVSFLPNVAFIIKNKMGQSGQGAIEIRRRNGKGGGLFGFLLTIKGDAKEEYSGFTDVLPTNETEGAIREIGAIINDLQELGDLGIEKWKK